MKQFTKFICAVVVLLGMSMSAWGADETLTLNKDDWSDGGYADGTTTKNTSASTSIGISYKRTFNNSYIQMEKNGGEFHSTSYPTTNSRIKSIKVNNTTNTALLYGSADGASWTSISYTNNTAETVTSYGYKYFKVAASTKYSQVSEVVVVYTAPTAQTVTFNKQGGTFDDESVFTRTTPSYQIDEASGGAGITLPSVSPSSACAKEGWVFCGWSTSVVGSSTTTAPTIVGNAGDTYYPASAITLHAVFAKGEYAKVTSTGAISSGEKYIIAAEYSGDNYVMTNTVSIDAYGQWLVGTVINEDPANKYHAAKINPAWLCTLTATDDKYYIQNASGGWIDTYYSSSDWLNHTPQDTYDKYTIDFSAGDGSCTIMNSYGDEPYLVLYDDGTFGPLGEGYPMYLYKVSETPYYWSTPDCCDKIVELNAGTKTNVSSIAFSSDEVATCSSTATDRQVTVTVTTNTGYKMVDALGFTKTGTVTATKKSGPTGSGPYTYVYEFNQNDNGTGTFSATATAKTYTVTLDGNGGTGHTASVTTTYNSSTLSSSITNPTKEGYRFDGWYSGSGGTGSLVISTSGALQANVSTYTGAGGIWTKDGGTTLYAKWTVNQYKLTLASPTTVTISSTTPTLAEGGYANVDYGSSVTLAYSSLVDGRQWGGWKVTKDDDETNVTGSVVSTNTLTMPAYDVTVTAETYGDFAFSCGELTLTGPTGDLVFITSAASKTVRSQEAFHVTGSGLTPSTTLTFAMSDPTIAYKFAFKQADGSAVATDASGAIDMDFYVFYTPASGDTEDGLDIFTNLSASISGTKPKASAALTDKTVIGRHLPADFVIAAQNSTTKKWYALPANFSDEQTPAPIEISVDDINNPSVAYTANTNIYNLYGQNSGASGFLYKDGDDDGNPDGEKIKLGMKNNSNYPLFAFAGTSSALKGDGTATVTNNINKQYWWTLTQTNTSITNPQDAKYTIASSNNAKTLAAWFNATPQKWGLFAAGNGEHTLRIIPASSAVFTEAYFIEWGKNSGVVEVDKGTATLVKAILNGEESEKIELSQTGTSKGKTSVYNYTVNFGSDIDFSAASSEGAMLTLEWYNGASLVAVSNITVPKIVASDITINKTNYTNKSDWNKEVHVLPGKKVTIDPSAYDGSNVTIKELNIYPGATVKVTAGTLIATTLVLRNGWTRATEKNYDVARLHIATTANMTHTNAYADWYIDYDQYYPMAVPWDVTVSGISYRYTSLAATVGHDKNIRLRYYDGALRVNGGNGTGTNWRLYGDAGAESVPTTLKPSQGYAITAKRPAGKAFAILRMPLTFADTWTTGGEQGRYDGEVKDTVHVIAHGVGANPAKPWYAVGWNFIGNPYMSCFDSNEDDFMNKLIDENGKGVKYATIPDTEFEGFDQVNIASVGNKLKPSSGFFVQVGTTGSLQFKQGKIITPSAPARYTNEQEAIPEQEALILLNGEQGHDQMGLVIGSDYTADYEMNADLSKMLGNANIVKTWMRYTDMDMAYVAINEQLAREWIPVTVHIPAEGEYTYSLMNSSTVDELEGLYLIDYETSAITNLIYDEYIFTAEAGTQSGRFAINAIVGERKVPTGADITGVDKNGNEPVKFIWHDKVYILHNSVIYDATGKRVNVINK